MAVPDLIQSAVWPGVVAVESCQYVCSHGISPGRAILVTYPQLANPDEFGTLAFSDGRKSFAVKGCKVESMTPRWTPEGISFTLEILDARWMWAGKGAITGHYNQKDGRGKLVPWTIRSPQELAKLLFDALGISNYTVQFPPGLPQAAGADVNRYLQAGENFAQTGIQS